MAEHLRIQSVALGRPMPTRFPVYSAPIPEAPVEPEMSLSTQTGLLEEPPADAASSLPPIPDTDSSLSSS